MKWGTEGYDGMLLGQIEPKHVRSLPRGVSRVDPRLKLKRKTRDPKSAPVRRRDAERTKAEILAAGIREFSERGLNGARVDNIAARTHTNKRMIYYYFKSKQRLYTAVLEEAYRRIREAEKQLRLDDLPPDEAIRCLAEFTFDYHWKNPELAKLVVIENVHKGKNLSRSESISRFNLSIIDAIAKVLGRGAEQGVLRQNIDPVELHMTVSALSLFHVTNRYTFGTVFRRDMVSTEAAAQRKKEVVDIISRYVSA